MIKVELSGKVLEDWKSYLLKNQIFQNPALMPLIDIPQRFWMYLATSQLPIDFNDPSRVVNVYRYQMVLDIISGTDHGLWVVYSSNMDDENHANFQTSYLWNKVGGAVFLRTYCESVHDFTNLFRMANPVPETGIAFFLSNSCDIGKDRELNVSQLINDSTHVLYEAFDGDGYVCGELLHGD